MSDSEGDGGDYGRLVQAQNRRQKRAGGWQAMGLDASVYRGVEKKGYRAPTPIQRRAIPSIIDGRDVVAMARTGSGKTAAFLIPLFQKLKRRCVKSGARALLIAPTRELVLQTFRFVKEIGKYTGLRAAVLVGGDSMEEQFQALHESPDILIATPGRLMHLVIEMNLKLSSIEYVCFDEADRLFELGFAEQLADTLRRLPETRQTILFSATLPKVLVDFAKAGLTDPVLVRLDVDSKISEQLDTCFLVCRPDEKLPALLYLLKNHLNGTQDEQTIVFCATKYQVEYVYEVLTASGIQSTFLYSSLDATARNINIGRFRQREVNILIVTDVAARGVDIPLLQNAVNLHFPPKPKLFVHRVGRVARAGKTGKAYSLLTPDEFAYAVDLFLFLGRPFSLAPTVPGEAAGDGDILGLIPRVLLDNDIETLKQLVHRSVDLAMLGKTADNSMKSYVRSRPVASSESIRRLKHADLKPLSKLDVGVHPMFSQMVAVDAARNELLRGIRNWKPNMTVFEMNASNKNSEYRVMKAKRKRHQELIHRNKELEQKRDDDAQMERKTSTAPIFDETSANKDIQETFAEVIGAKKTRSESRSATSQAKYFLPNRPADFHTEEGLAVDKSSFGREAQQAVLDFTADEVDGRQNRQTNNQMVWDRKKKKFVGKEGNDRKTYRLDNGRRVSASFKTGRYERWQKKRRTVGDAADNDGDTTVTRSTALKRRRQQRGGQTTGRTARPELKGKEQILKERKRKEKVQSYQKYRQKQNVGSRRGGRK